MPKIDKIKEETDYYGRKVKDVKRRKNRRRVHKVKTYSERNRLITVSQKKYLREQGLPLRSLRSLTRKEAEELISSSNPKRVLELKNRLRSVGMTK